MSYSRKETLFEKIKGKFISHETKFLEERGFFKTMGGLWNNGHNFLFSKKEALNFLKNS
jgi:hypothetical protein